MTASTSVSGLSEARRSSLAELQSILDERRRRAGIPGMSIRVVDAHSGSWTMCSGFAAPSVPMTETTKAHLFSGTKLFTAVAVMKLVEQGKFGLDTQVASLLKPSDGQDWESLLPGVTVKALLSHSSGISDAPMRAFLGITLADERPLSTSEALSNFKIEVKGRTPTSKSRYANINFALLGQVIADTSGQPYEEYVRHEVLEPLQSEATFLVPAEESGQMATGFIGRFTKWALQYVMDSTQLRKLLEGGETNVCPDVARGLSTLGHFNLNGSAFGGLVGDSQAFAVLLHEFLARQNHVLSPEKQQQMLDLHSKGAAGIESKIGVGLGFKLGHTLDGRQFFNHEGGGGGFTTEMRLYPEAELGIVILMNCWSLNMVEVKLAHQLCELIHAAATSLDSELGRRFHRSE